MTARPTHRPCRVSGAAALLLTGLAAGCASSASSTLEGDASVWLPADLGSPFPDDGGGASVFAQIGFAGCTAVSGDAGVVTCTGAAPLHVTLVPVTAAGASRYLWGFSDGGVPPSSTLSSPEAAWPMPGSYDVRLAVGFGEPATSHATAAARITVMSSPTGGTCAVDAQCAPGEQCLCGVAMPDAGLPCPSDLAGGLCTRGCTGGGCGEARACVDLSRSAAGAPGVAAEPFRHPVCLPACTSSLDCRPGFQCRDLPVLVDGAGAGGAFTWRKACFATTLWDVGHACSDGNGNPAPGDCVGGACAALGARNLCTSPCVDPQANPCPSTAACATFNFDPGRPFCLPLCDVKNPCTDPLLECQAPSAIGWYGFTVGGGPMGATYCAPRRCSVEADCGLAGRCVNPLGTPDGGVVSDGGIAPVRFCLP